ncbi:MAG: hypothetical protein J0I41_04430 [Filimonas sp.]|nr:hypothetical protein [Filimonas sp.]
MKPHLPILLSLLLTGVQHAFSQSDTQAVYSHAMKLYDAKNYHAAAQEIDKVFSLSMDPQRLYNIACIYALDHHKERAFDILYHLANKCFYDNDSHLSSDSDLSEIHADARWAPLTEIVKKNKATAPERRRATYATELTNAQQLLKADGGKLWGQQVWDDHILILDYDNTIYSTTAFPGSKTTDGRLFSAAVPAGTFVFVNTVQSYMGQDYAIVLSNYVSDHSITIIHELFHLLQQKNIKLKGDAIKYLDNYDTRQWLRLEYAALRRALTGIKNKAANKDIRSCLEDALLFRKLRQNAYKNFLQNELEIETLEGLANYTGFALSSESNKYQAAISEIDQREAAQTYTRPFPYATGVAYGLIYDYLGIPWKAGLKKVYNFLSIYEAQKKITTGESVVEMARLRNNFTQIHNEEVERRKRNDSLQAYYTNLLQRKPTLKAVMTDNDNYGLTYNMNGTIELPGIGTVYSSISGRDKSGKNFGKFKTLNEKAYLGNAGILILSDFKTVIFPAPVKIEGQHITGDVYEIELNDGWIVEKLANGDFLIKSGKAG